MPKLKPCKRPKRQACITLAIVNVVASGILGDDAERAGAVQLLVSQGPKTRANGAKTACWTPIRAILQDAPGNLQRATLVLGGAYSGHVWADQHAVKIHPGRHWCFRCQGCDQPARLLFWPPSGACWRCRSCLRPRYAAKLSALRPAPENLDAIDRLVRDALVLQKIARQTHRYQSMHQEEPA
jgi:hypothetical protein